MLVETNNLVSTEDFRKELDKYVAAARDGCGPIVLTKESEIVGFFLSADEYEVMFGATVSDLLSSRSKGPKVPHEKVKARIRKITRPGSQKS